VINETVVREWNNDTNKNFERVSASGGLENYIWKGYETFPNVVSTNLKSFFIKNANNVKLERI